MKRFAIGISAATLSLALAMPAMAQSRRDEATGTGLIGGAAAGAAIGAAGGPVGAVGGAIIGGAAGASAGAALTPDDRVYVRQYVQTRRVRPVVMERDVRIGMTLPRERVTYHRFEGNPRLASYRYAVVNDQTVLVDRGGRVVQIID